MNQNKLNIFHSENKAKQNRYDFPSASSIIIKCLEDFEKMAGFCKSFCPIFSKGFHINFNPSQNVSTILLLNGLVIVTNERLIVFKYLEKGNVRKYSI